MDVLDATEPMESADGNPFGDANEQKTPQNPFSLDSDDEAEDRRANRSLFARAAAA